MGGVDGVEAADNDTGPVLDAHVHLWDPNRLSYPWLAEAPAINRAFTGDDFAALHAEPVEAVFVEAGRDAAQAGAEVEWVRTEAAKHAWIRGAVAHVTVENPVQAVREIRRHAEDPFVVGVRRNVQEEAPGFTEHADFRVGVRLLGQAGLPFDACVRQHQLPELVRLADACPDTTIILDHLGKPQPTGRDEWSRDLRQVAEQPNVVCKLSGLATEVVGADAPQALMVSLLREALEVFGPERCLYAGDWPVMTLATDYRTWLDVVREALAPYPAAAAAAVFRGTARRVYRLAAKETQ
ncbi:MAG: amidohydrolase family protein [Catenulispora sp.]|nr:amidohydrolase family protein [Catenulispora sp.]